MRVLFFSSSNIWGHNLPMGFREAGHEVKVSGEFTDKRIPQVIKEFQPHFVMSMGWSPDQTKEKQDCISKYAKEMNLPNIYWSLEDPNHTEYFTIPLIQTLKPDFVFTICESTINRFNGLGFKAARLDFGFDPGIHRPVNKEGKYSCAVAVVANAYPHLLQKPDLYRLESLRTLVGPLLRANIPVDFWGNDWDRTVYFLGKRISKKHNHGYLPYFSANKVYSSAKIILGLQNNLTQVTQRTFEILGSEGFLITSDIPGIRSLFKPGRDLVVSASPEETVKLVKYYLNNPSERELVRKQGRTAVDCHSYKKRAEYIIDTLKRFEILPRNLQ